VVSTAGIEMRSRFFAILPQIQKAPQQSDVNRDMAGVIKFLGFHTLPKGTAWLAAFPEGRSRTEIGVDPSILRRVGARRAWSKWPFFSRVLAIVNAG
jgi:hypothetical protein